MDVRDALRVIRKQFFDVDIEVVERASGTLIEVVNMQGGSALMKLAKDGSGVDGSTIGLNGRKVTFSGPLESVARELALAF